MTVTPSRPSEVGESPATVRTRVAFTMARVLGRRAELITFGGLPEPGEHVACALPPAAGRAPLVRLHSECLTGDLFGSERCDCGPQLDEALELIGKEGGTLLYLRQEGRGIGLYNKLDAYVLQDQGADTFEANRMLGRGSDERDYGVAAAMLKALGQTRIRLLTNNPDKVSQLQAHGIEVVEVIPTHVHMTPENIRYLSTKAESGGHTLDTERAGTHEAE
ncbi:GTP cyclohydrolase-2 [Streptomyces sp. TS71-3]|nr:GTP cyclohydrolase-2 [Streptomyces sp. TS71-3]